MMKPLWLGLALLLAGCGAKPGETLSPIYQAEKIELRDANIEYWSEIAPTTIEPSTIRRVARAIFGWIPIVGDLVELPLDLTSVVLPPLSGVSHPELPPDGEWNDARLLAIVKQLKLGRGFIRITPIAERKNYKPETCWFFWDCEDVLFPDFLKEVRIYLIFQDLKPIYKDRVEALEEKPEVLLALADIERNYDAQTQTLHFDVSDENIRPYLDQYGKFEIKIVALGGFPRHKVWLDGKLRVDMKLRLAKESN